MGKTKLRAGLIPRMLPVSQGWHSPVPFSWWLHFVLQAKPAQSQLQCCLLHGAPKSSPAHPDCYLFDSLMGRRRGRLAGWDSVSESKLFGSDVWTVWVPSDLVSPCLKLYYCILFTHSHRHLKFMFFEFSSLRTFYQSSPPDRLSTFYL